MWWDEIDMWIYGVDLDLYLGFGGWKKIGYFIQVYIFEICNMFDLNIFKVILVFYNRNKEYFNV